MWTSAAGYNLKLFTDFNVSTKKKKPTIFNFTKLIKNLTSTRYLLWFCVWSDNPNPRQVMQLHFFQQLETAFPIIATPYKCVTMCEVFLFLY